MKNLISILILLFTTLGISQTPNDTIYIDSINIEYLEDLILEEINRFRTTIYGVDVNTFEMSEKGRRQCRAWSNKLNMENSFIHNHNYHECLAKTTLYDGVNTYGKFSKHIVNMWINSPGHKKALLVQRLGYPYPLYAGVGVSVSDFYTGYNKKHNGVKQIIITWRGLI